MSFRTPFFPKENNGVGTAIARWSSSHILQLVYDVILVLGVIAVMIIALFALIRINNLRSKPVPLTLNVTEVMTPNDVRYYGAKCDGVTDDTAAIQAAASSTTAPTINFPQSTCIIRSGIIMSVAGKTFTGSRQTSVIKAEGGVAGFTMLTLTANNIVVSNIQLDASKDTPPSSGTTKHVQLGTVNGTRFDGVTFKNGGHWGLLPLPGSSQYETTFESCTFQDFYSSASIPPSALEIVSDGNVHRLTVSNSRFYRLTGCGVNVRSVSGTVKDILVVGCEFVNDQYAYTSFGVTMTNVSNGVVSASTFRNGRAGVSLLGVGIAVTGNTFENHTYCAVEWGGSGTITGNSMTSYTSGILLVPPTATSQVSIEGNHFSYPYWPSSANEGWAVKSANPMQSITATGNTITESNGFRFDGCGECAVSGNSMTSSVSTVFLFALGVTATSVTSNAIVYLGTSVGSRAIYFSGVDISISNNRLTSAVLQPGSAIQLELNLAASCNRIRILNNYAYNWTNVVTTGSGPTCSDTLVNDNWGSTVALNAGTFGLQRNIISSSAAPTTGTWAVGDIAFNSAPTSISSNAIGWICVTAGTPGTWRTITQLFQNGGFALAGDASVTLTPYTSLPVLYYQSPITATRTVTLSTTNGNPYKWTIVRSGAATGAFNVVTTGNVPCTLSQPGTWCEMTFYGASTNDYVVTGMGYISALPVASVSGTTNQITATGTTTPVLSIPATFVAPGSVTATTSLTATTTTRTPQIICTGSVPTAGAYNSVAGSGATTTVLQGGQCAFLFTFTTGSSPAVPGSGGSSLVRLTFATAFPTLPICVAQVNTNNNPPQIRFWAASATTTAIDLIVANTDGSSALTGGGTAYSFSILCMGY